MKSVFDVLNIIGSQLKEFLGLHLKLGPLHRRQEDWRKHNHCRLVGGRFNKQGTYICVCDRIRSLPSAHQNLKIRFNWVQSHQPSRWSQLHVALWRLCPGNSSWCGNGGQKAHFKDKGGWGASDCSAQIKGQPAVLSSRWPPQTSIIKFPSPCQYPFGLRVNDDREFITQPLKRIHLNQF